MADANPIEVATRRLAAALDALEAAAERRRDGDRDEEALKMQIHTLGVDRSRLAADLDAQVAHSRRLEAINQEIAGRLDRAIDGVRSVLDARDR